MKQYHIKDTTKVLFNYESCKPYNDTYYGMSYIYYGVTGFLDLTPEDCTNLLVSKDDILVFRNGEDIVYKGYCLSDFLDDVYETFYADDTCENIIPLFSYATKTTSQDGYEVYSDIFPLSDKIDFRGVLRIDVKRDDDLFIVHTSDTSTQYNL